ncbi:hypothetical protein B0H16DRAFT_1742577 [Mycena metata]|uniref:Uncharacterized protein n=1 Tax=Mycena metata TaxID=1033252 RepID=A0AAD7H8F3_9AGAR|nr:hypothetical protein B0H16DRAFT_1742577 [Mycena metata]
MSLVSYLFDTEFCLVLPAVAHSFTVISCRVYRVSSPLPCFSARLGCIAGDRVLSASLTGSEAVTTRHSLPFASGLRGYFKGHHLPQLPGAACSRADYAIGPGSEPTAISFQGIS